jgi:serine/threonine-protein kinase ATR
MYALYQIQKEASKGKNPPFFKESTSYYNWLSAWGRFMIESSHKNDKSRYNDLFYACRSAIRSEAGIGILEFLLPLLVLDTICFGGDAGRVATADEMRGVLSCCLNGHKAMDKMELQKAIAVVFMIIETFQSWADVEIEDRFSSQRSSKSYNPRETRNSKDLEEKSDWPSEISVELIGELLKKIKLSLCAKAAAHAGMFAQSLRFLEVQARKSNANDLYDATVSIGIDDKESIKPVTSHLPHTSYGQGIDLSLAHLLFGELNDCDSMNAVSKCRRQPDIIENIREKEAYTDWDGVLRLCEQASQIRLLQKNKEEHMHNYIRTNSRNTESEYLDIAYLKALLELGQLDSAFNQVRGMLPVAHEGGKPTFRLCNENVSMDLLVPYAVQASWRLSRWDALAQLLNVSSPNNSDWKTIQKVDLDGQYNMALGRSMLNLHKKNETGVMDALENARKAIIPPLSVVARENYIRTYPYLLKLHCLREIEDSCGVLCQSNSSDEISKQFINLTEMDWGWKARLDTAGTNTSASIHIITTRLALARLSSNLPIEASLWLDAGKRARKGGLYHVAENCLSHADAIYQHLQAKCLDEGASSMAHLNIRASEVSLQLAKIKHSMGKSTEALLMVRQEDFDLLQTKTDESRSKAVDILKKDGRLEFFARRALQATEWMVESGLKSGSEVMARYRLLNDISPGWERGRVNCFQTL